MIHISNIEHTGQAFIVLPVDLDTMVQNVTIGHFLLHDIEAWSGYKSERVLEWTKKCS